ncbi:SEC-C metal-binding domain-containing protein [Endothiovibrio diazotrophicus]
MSEPSILHHDEGDHYHLHLNQGEWAGRRYAVELHACDSPLCHCGDVNLKCTPIPGDDGHDSEEEVPIPTFTLDPFAHRTMTAPGEPPPPPLAEALLVQFSADDWKELADHVIEAKRRGMERLDPATADLAPLGARVAEEPTAMIGYAELFPYEEELLFSRGDQRWLADDQYCVDPKCNCRHTVLSFTLLPEGEPAEPITEEQWSVGLFKYDSGKIEPIPPAPPGWPAVGELVAALLADRPGLVATLKQRHERMRTFAREALKQAAPARPVRRATKIGRNDPCPCGSGRKYKKCCGA